MNSKQKEEIKSKYLDCNILLLKHKKIEKKQMNSH